MRTTLAILLILSAVATMAFCCRRYVLIQVGRNEYFGGDPRAVQVIVEVTRKPWQTSYVDLIWWQGLRMNMTRISKHGMHTSHWPE